MTKNQYYEHYLCALGEIQETLDICKVPIHERNEIQAMALAAVRYRILSVVDIDIEQAIINPLTSP